MAKSEIESWIASTSSIPDDNESDNSGPPEWRRDLILTDWHEAMGVAQRRLYASSTKARIQFLREELLYIAKFGGKGHSVYSLAVKLTAN